MAITAQIVEAIWALVDPWFFMGISASWLPYTIKTLVKDGHTGTLFSPSKFQDAWFSNFWGWAGPNIKLRAQERVLPLLEGRVQGGRIVDEPIGPGIEGVCIEVGPGSGFWVDVFSDKRLDRSTSATSNDDGVGLQGAVASQGGNRKPVTRVYGVEPSHDQHVNLRKNISEAGLENVYEIVPVGIEDLDDPSKWGDKIEKGSVDCIVFILCLCSIPDPQHNLKELYKYLKPGGRWYVYEHVRIDHSWCMRMYQAFVNLFWPHFLGGCQLCRPTELWMKEAGPWEKIDVGQPSDEQWHQVVPHILGVYTK
ncbi:methyltransferase domain-containing protein [Seiridium cupressi]